MSIGAVIDRFYAALSVGDLESATACFTADATIWHNYDCRALTLGEALPSWQQLVAVTAERGITDIRRHEPLVSAGADVCAQQHVFYTRTASGEGTGLPCCIIVRTRDGLIARLDEYIDVKGGFSLAPGEEPRTPGLAGSIA